MADIYRVPTVIKIIIDDGLQKKENHPTRLPVEAVLAKIDLSLDLKSAMTYGVMQKSDSFTTRKICQRPYSN